MFIMDPPPLFFSGFSSLLFSVVSHSWTFECAAFILHAQANKLLLFTEEEIQEEDYYNYILHSTLDFAQ